MTVEEIIERKLIHEILGNIYEVGSFLPPERKLAEKLGFSRPAVHKALIRLENKGLVTIVARQGVRVNDYRVTGKLDLLDTLYHMYKWEIDEHIHRSTFKFIKENLFLVLRDAALESLENKKDMCFSEAENLYKWILNYALATNNFIYPLLFNEFKVGIENVSKSLEECERKDYMELRLRVDQEVLKGNVEGIRKNLEDFFDFVEFHWLERCKSEGFSEGKNFFKGGL